MRYLWIFCSLTLLCSSIASAAGESKAAKIARAMSAAPASIARSATIVDMSASGKTTVLRKGTNGFTCTAGHKGVVGDDPMCGDAAGMQWGMDWGNHKKAPTNKVPGIIYMLAGGTDWSASNPWATKGTPIVEPPHWMIMWPFATSSGLPTSAKQTGSWIMWAGTPYAHVMVNSRP